MVCISSRCWFMDACVPIVAALLLLVSGQIARGDEAGAPGHTTQDVQPAARLPERERKRRLRELRKRASRWHHHRKRFPSRCHHCDGRGKILSHNPRRTESVAYQDEEGNVTIQKGRTRIKGWQTCPTCKGHKQYISEKSFMKVYYEMRSPAFRLRKDSMSEVAALLAKARQGDPWPTKIRYAGFKKSELVDPEHAIAWYRFDRDRTWRPTRWIRRADGDTRPTWFLYDETVDGAWPGEAPAEPAGG